MEQYGTDTRHTKRTHKVVQTVQLRHQQYPAVSTLISPFSDAVHRPHVSKQKRDRFIHDRPISHDIAQLAHHKLCTRNDAVKQSTHQCRRHETSKSPYCTTLEVTLFGHTDALTSCLWSPPMTKASQRIHHQGALLRYKLQSQIQPVQLTLGTQAGRVLDLPNFTTDTHDKPIQWSARGVLAIALETLSICGVARSKDLDIMWARARVLLFLTILALHDVLDVLRRYVMTPVATH